MQGRILILNSLRVSNAWLSVILSGVSRSIWFTHHQSFSAAAIAVRFASADSSLDDGAYAADPRFYRDCHRGAVLGAGAAFHAVIPVDNPYLSAIHDKHGVWAHVYTHATADTSGLVVPQSHDVANILKCHNKSIPQVSFFSKTA
jgi:hypothetical protein